MKNAWSLCALITAVFVSCSPGGGTKQERVTLMHYFTGNLSAGIQELASVVNREDSSLVMEASPLEHEEFKAAIRTQLEGPNPPDLFSYWAGAKTLNLVQRGAVAPLDSIFGTSIPPDTFPLSVYQALVYEGKPYMVPITRHYVGFFYNPQLFRQAGIEVPASWDEFLKACATLKAKGITPLSMGAKSRWPAQFWFDYLLLRSAGFQWRQELMDGKHAYTDGPVQAVMKEWKALLDHQWFNTDAADIEWDDAAYRVMDGKAGMTLIGTWLIGSCTEKGYKYPDDYGFFVFPSLGLKEENAALGPIDGIMLSAGSRHPAQALRILSRLAQAEPQETFSLAAGSISPRNGGEDKLSPLLKEVKHMVDMSTHWAFNFDLATSPERSEIGLNQMLSFVRKPAALDSILIDWDKAIRGLER